MDILNKHFWKFLVGLLAMMLVGLSLAYGTSWYEKQQLKATTLKQQQGYAAYEARYLNDTYGSTTPEGTLQLFIDALKKNDIDLAVKYIFIDEREKVKTDLEQVQVGSGFSNLVSRFSLLRLSKKDEDRAFFLMTGTNNELQSQVLVKKNSIGIWKIVDL